MGYSKFYCRFMKTYELYKNNLSWWWLDFLCADVESTLGATTRNEFQFVVVSATSRTRTKCVVLLPQRQVRLLGLSRILPRTNSKRARDNYYKSWGGTSNYWWRRSSRDDHIRFNNKHWFKDSLFNLPSHHMHHCGNSTTSIFIASTEATKTMSVSPAVCHLFLVIFDVNFSFTMPTCLLVESLDQSSELLPIFSASGSEAVV